MNIEQITSIKDPRVQEARSLQTASGRMEKGKCLLYGKEQICWAQQAHLPIDYIFVEHADDSSCANMEVPLLHVSAGILKKISSTNYVIPCIGVATISSSNSSSMHSDFIVVLDNLQDLGNIGSIIRTAQGFSIDQFLFANMQGDPYQRKTIDASRGLIFQSNVVQKKDPQQALAYLKKHDYQIVVTSPHAPSLQSQAPLSSGKLALIVGNETSGVCDTFLNAADIAIQIPMSPHVESLNAAVSAGISVYELKFKQVLAMLKEKIISTLGRKINVIGMLFRQALDQAMRMHTNLSGMHAILLMILHCDQTMSKEQIAQDVALVGDELEAFLQPLVQHNYIIKQNETYALTPAGKHFIAQIWPIIEKTHQKILADFTRDEIEQLEKLLSKLEQGCIAIINDMAKT